MKVATGLGMAGEHSPEASPAAPPPQGMHPGPALLPSPGLAVMWLTRSFSESLS